jgi:hypothetical protein
LDGDNFGCRLGKLTKGLHFDVGDGDGRQTAERLDQEDYPASGIDLHKGAHRPAQWNRWPDLLVGWTSSGSAALPGQKLHMSGMLNNMTLHFWPYDHGVICSTKESTNLPIPSSSQESIPSLMCRQALFVTLLLHLDYEIVAKSRKRFILHFTGQRISSTSRPFLSTVQDDNGVDLKLEETYSCKTTLEHILLRPVMYIGSTECLPPVSGWVLREDLPSSYDRNVNYDPTTAILWVMQREELLLVPALLKVFEKILANASDNHLWHLGMCN